MRDAELELEAELEDLMITLAESDLESEVEGQIPPDRGGTTLNCRPPIVLNGFRSGEYTLLPQHYAALFAVPLGGAIILIRGHSDNQGAAATNVGVSLSRAFEVLQWLTNRKGRPPIAGQVIVEGFGAATPVAANTNEAGRSANRRVEIFLCKAPPPPPVFANAARIVMNSGVA
jgi:OmpA family